MTKNYPPLNDLRYYKEKSSIATLILVFIFMMIQVQSTKAQINYTTAGSPYVQNFDGLFGSVPADNSTVASSTLPTGWIMTEAGSGANTLIRVHSGAGTTGDTYLDGVTSSNERALGSFASGSLTSQYGAFFTNSTGSTLTQFTLTYMGEQWRDGGSATSVINTISFAYAVAPTSLTVGSYTNVTALNFVAPISNLISDVALDGNVSPNRTLRTATVTGISWAPGQSLYIRWTDVNDAGNDDNLAIDSVTFSASTGSVASVAIAPAHPVAAAINQGSSDNIIAAISLNTTLASTDINSITLQTGGTYGSSSDFTDFKFWLSNSASSIAGATQLGSTLASVTSGSNLSVSGLSNTLTAGSTKYILVTTSVSATGTVGSTLLINPTSFSNITFSSATTTGVDPVSASNEDTIVAIPPSIALSDLSPAAGTINQSSTNNILRSIEMNVSSASAVLNSVSVNTAGTYISSDLQSNSFKIWYNTSNSLAGAVQLGTNQPIVSSGGTIAVSGLSQTIPLGTSYILVTVDVSYNASSSRNISISSTPFSDLSFTTGVKTGTDPVNAGNVQTFGVVVPSIIISQLGPSTGNISQGTNNRILYQLGFAVSSNGTDLNSLEVTTAGTYQITDFVADSMKLWFNTSNNLATASRISYQSVVASGSNILFSGLNQFINLGTTGYVWITGDVATGAISARNINITSTPFTNILFSDGTKSGTDPSAAGGVQTITPVLTQTDFISVNTPLYMASGTSTRLPIMFRATVTSLDPLTTYRYFTSGTTNSTTGGGTVDFGTTNTGAGNPLFLDSTGTIFNYSTAASLLSAGNYDVFTTDSSGEYTGWFGFVNTGNARFTAGNAVYPSIIIGDNISGATLFRRALDVSVKPLAFSTSAGVNNGSFIKENTSGAIPKNFVLLYDNVAGSGRPLFISPVQSIGVSIASVISGFTTGAGGWNAIIPNTNPNGVQRIEQVTASNVQLCYSIEASGVWPTGTVNTVDPRSGTTALIISSADVPLSPPAILTQPLGGQIVCQSHASIPLAVVASGAGLTYQWYSNSTPVISGGTSLGAGATSDTFIAPTSTSGTTYYYCQVSNTCESFTDVVSVTVLPSSSGSFSQSICSSSTYSFNGVDLNTSGSYLDTLSSVTGCDSIVTLNLTVVTCPVIPNDSRCTPSSVASSGIFTESSIRNLGSTNPDCDTLFGNTLGAGSEAGEVFGSAAGGGGTQHTLWYIVNAPTCVATSIRFSTNTSPTAYDTRLTAYHRSIPSVCGSTYIELASNNDDGLSPIPTASTVLLTPGAGTVGSSTYAAGQPIYVQVSGFNGASGDYGMIVDVDAADLTLGAITSSSIAVNIPTTTYGSVSNIYLRYRLVGAPLSSYAAITLPGSATSGTISGLVSGASYDIWVMYRCTADDRWVTKKITGTTTAGCEVPVAGPVVSAGSSCTSKVLTWTPSTLATRYIVYYKRVGQIGYNSINVTAPTTTATLTGLLTGTNYQFWIQAVCSGGSYATSPFSYDITCGVAPRMSDSDMNTEDGVYAYNNLEFHHMPITAIASQIAANDPSATNVNLTKVDATETSTPVMALANNLSIYPNPAQTEATISYLLPTESDEMTIKVYDVQGKEMMNENITDPSMIGTYDIKLNNYAGGVYFVKVQSNNYSETRKLVVDKD